MTTFAELGLPHSIVYSLNGEGMHEAFPIQAAAIPDALSGKDILGRAPTGSGKTLCFGIPMVARLSQHGHSIPGRPRALILVPTRELATQVQQRLSPIAHAQGLRIIDVVGGVAISKQVRQFAAPIDILVATPGRTLDLIHNKHLDLSDVSITAIDEADQMADMGFLPQVQKILRKTPPTSQRLLFSATLDGDVSTLIDEFLTDPVLHSTSTPEAAVDTMRHYQFAVTNKDDRTQVVLHIGARKGQTIMFTRTKYAVDKWVRKLRRAGIHAAGLHGNKGQTSRTAVIDAFSNGKINVLVATDIAARGIDISTVDLVVHIDPPVEPKSYVHRAGRTARAGSTGSVVTLFLPDQQDAVESVLTKAGVTLDVLHIHALSPRLKQITGAKTPSGKTLGDFQPIETHALTNTSKSQPHTVKSAAQPRQTKPRKKKKPWGGTVSVSRHGAQKKRNR
ncbi:DNA/RNA helicase, superfamily II [Corynebacterium mustelae]|uniref:DNA/RNA helicase, superfamily II n=1 Tax=Corynebacterium mustelae TaxID=571915 RepID=A0A0G3GXK2_9CORY|nr:DEAD/DEAH box helicase [Corynebacterium mustelae]AKK05896.1 DNA/RNA helicase, superfamily II [Corynebacterium mustelae]